jgi:hypothetical protein
MSEGSVNQYGDGNIGRAEHSGSGDIVAGGKTVHYAPQRSPEFEELLRAIEALRPHLGGGDRAEVDTAVEELAAAPSESRTRTVLSRIAGIATLVGEVGAPVVGAVRALLG